MNAANKSVEPTGGSLCSQIVSVSQRRLPPWLTLGVRPLMFAQAFLGGFELIMVSTFAMAVIGGKILERTSKKRRGLRVLGVALLTLGGVLFALCVAGLIFG